MWVSDVERRAQTRGRMLSVPQAPSAIERRSKRPPPLPGSEWDVVVRVTRAAITAGAPRSVNPGSGRSKGAPGDRPRIVTGAVRLAALRP